MLTQNLLILKQVVSLPCGLQICLSHIVFLKMFPKWQDTERMSIQVKFKVVILLRLDKVVS